MKILTYLVFGASIWFFVLYFILEKDGRQQLNRGKRILSSSTTAIKPKEVKNCPYCIERISAESTVCRHCKKEL